MKKIVVIGAGILGASAAYHLAKMGAEVTIIDRKDAGQATEAAAGIICPWLSQRRNKAWYELAKSGAAYYEQLIPTLEQEGETATGYKKVGALSLHTDDKKIEQMEKRAIDRRVEAPEIGDIRMLTAVETSAQMPILDEIYQSIEISGGARVNGRALRDALLRSAEKHGAVRLDGSAKIELIEGRRVIVVANEQQFQADAVVVAAGAWAKELFSPLNIDLQVGAQKAQIAHLQVTDEHTGEWPVVMPPNNQYMLAFDDGEIVVGATYEDHIDNLDVTVGGLHEIFDKALSVASKLQYAEFKEAKIGFRPFTPNFMPVIGVVPTLEHVYFANGLGSSGLTVGPFLGSQLAKLALEEIPDLDLTPYDVAQILS